MSQGTGVRERAGLIPTPSPNGSRSVEPTVTYDILKDRLFRAILLVTLVVLSGVMAFALIFDGVSHRRTAASAAPASSTASSTGYGMAAANGHVVNVALTSVETDQTILPAGSGVTPVTYHVWTFDG